MATLSERDHKKEPIAGSGEIKEMPKRFEGYRDLSEAEIELIVKIKTLGVEVGALCTELQGQSDDLVDKRWLGVGTSLLQQGLMAYTRAVSKPTHF